MILTLTLTLAALTTVIASPALLTLRPWQLRHPQASLAIWFGTFLLGIVLAALALTSTILTSVSVIMVATDEEAAVLSFAAWFGLGGLGAIMALVGVAAEPLTLSYHHQLDDFSRVTRTREYREAFTLVRFDCDEAFAIAVPGRHPEILLSTACEEVLTTQELEAVLAHELAHLRYMHGWAVRIAEINALCVGWLPAGRNLRRSTLLLIELAADDTAARLAGPAHVASALDTLCEATGDQSLEARAVRIARKACPRHTHRHPPEAVRIAKA